MADPDPVPPTVLIVGGGFGGLRAARALAGAPVQVVLVDRQNHHLFQPLLYQVASATLSPADIAAPIRHILRDQANADVVLGEVASVDLDARRAVLVDGRGLSYDFLILAAGSRSSYFGRDAWAGLAPGLKTLEDALEIRRRFLLTFERAEQEEDPDLRREWLTFVIVGGGPTGVELAGTLKEMARLTLPQEFRRIRTDRARVILVEAGPGILANFGSGLSEKALQGLERIGVEVRLGQPITAIEEHAVQLGGERIPTRTVVWAAGVSAVPLGATLGVPVDRIGRVLVEPDLSLPGHPEVFVVGDLAAFTHGPGGALPGVAPVAIQQGICAAGNLLATLASRPRQAFRYRDKGSMATLGRGRAVAHIGRLSFTGYPAWLAWLFIHLMLLVDFRSRVFVFFEWLWAYLTTQPRARLILGKKTRDI
ncbi:NAD(P)/FAD-dependent oxidoreductase [Geothrix edaphica]|uniref:NADH dehydrogenase n=1 Tax=Geothrix edaphica TaxID=2927976 RepID=A0ABQ5PW95_9BACT|nr:NAD(P)/FAD-dependent oxidoreductase [Geothrix edaphica]GLH66638.1 NADH dehydrogenase [Geothrix edaphica]